MTQNIVVTSSFVDLDNQLFYEASYNKENKKLSLKIFNHRGVLKNKRTIPLTQPIADLFTAQEYLIGLNHNHHQIFIFDVRSHLKTMRTGQLNSHTGMTQKMRQNNQKFTLFYYNRQQPLIYGVFDQKHIFYFSLNNSSGEDSSNLSNSRNSNDDSSGGNYKCEIGRFYTSTQSISKLEVQYKQKKIQKPKSPKKRSVILQLSREDKQQRLEQSRRKAGSNNNIRIEIVTYVYALIKNQRKMREISVIWNNNIPQIDWNDQDNVFDFYYQNGWDLKLKTNLKLVGNRGMKRNDLQQVELTTTAKGHYQTTIKLSGNHQIFSSQQNLFIVDPQAQKIIGIYNRQYFQIGQCSTIPRSISISNTLLMLQRPDFKHLKFIFYVFNNNLSQFTSFPLIIELYYFQNQADQEMYLNKNIEKIFTPNGLIHPHFQNKVHDYLQTTSKTSQISSPASEKSSQEKEMRMMRREEERVSKVYIQKNPHGEAKEFLEKFVLRDTNLLYRLIYQLCNYGANVIFGEKQFAYSMFKERKSQVNSEKNSMIEPNEQSQKIESQELVQLQNSLKNRYRCNFDTWNEYFEEMIYKKVEALSKLCEAQSQNQQIRNESMINEGQTQIDNIFETINQVKEQLILLSNVYKRFAVLVQSSQRHQNGSSIRILQSYHEVITQKLNTIHSLFLIYNLLKVGTYQHQRDEPRQAEKRLKQAVRILLEKFEHKRKRNISQFKKLNQQIFPQDSLRNFTKSKLDFSVSKLMPHEFFNSAKQLIAFQSKTPFGVFMNYMLSNLSQFQQIAYFYFLLTNELHDIDQKQRYDHKFMRNNQSSVISASSNKPLIETQNRGLIFPYISSELIEFFEGLRQVQGFNENDNFSRFDNNLKIITVKRIQKLALEIRVDSFKLYIIQLCSQFKLPNQIIEIVDTIKIQPFVNSERHSDGQNYVHSQSQMKISRSFGQQQTFIIKSLINCAFNTNEYDNSANLRQLLFYQAKRILLIGDTMINHRDYQMEELNFYRNYFQVIQQNDSDKEKKGKKEPKQVKIPSIQLKQYLLAYFIEACLSYSEKQSIRQLEELKRQCLNSLEDKTFFQSVIDEFLENQRIKRN